MSRMKKFFALVCMSLLIFTACQSKPEGKGDAKGAAPAAAGTPTPEFLAAKLKCFKDATAVEDTDITAKTLLQALDRGDWKAVTLDAKAAEKYTLAWEYVMDQGGGKSISYTFGQSKAVPNEVIIYASTEVSGGASKAIEPGYFFSKIKAQADQLKSFK